MISTDQYMDELFQELIELLDIPTSYYQQATDRYKSLGRWFHRDKSEIAPLDPHVYVQGSFRYGTVTRPLCEAEEYDLDLVCEIALSAHDVTQKRVKELVGIETKSYAEAYNFNDPVREKKRCWRLEYADEVRFHMDVLPAIPEEEDFKRLLVGAGVLAEHAACAVAITDIRHPHYEVIDLDWPRSNPKGFARWFEDRMRAIARQRRELLVENRIYASVEEVPAYEWKTPLQRCIQLLKRHRDVMFQSSPDLKPISMILTTLAAHAYTGESSLYLAMSNILDRIPQFVMQEKPFVANPVNPAEDFADRWSEDSRLRDNFWYWYDQARADFASLGSLSGTELESLIRKRFSLGYSSDTRRKRIGVAAPAIPAVHVKTPSVSICTPPSPWGY